MVCRQDCDMVCRQDCYMVWTLYGLSPGLLYGLNVIRSVARTVIWSERYMFCRQDCYMVWNVIWSQCYMVCRQDFYMVCYMVWMLYGLSPWLLCGLNVICYVARTVIWCECYKVCRQDCFVVVVVVPGDGITDGGHGMHASTRSTTSSSAPFQLFISKAKVLFVTKNSALEAVLTPEISVTNRPHNV